MTEPRRLTPVSGTSAQGKPLFGIEEEVFITHPERTSLEALYYLAKLLWKNPGFYYSHSDSNFARGQDVRQALMGGVEISTSCQSEPESLIQDLASRRAELSGICKDALLVPLGHLLDLNAPTLTCGMHIHVGNLKDSENAYAGLVRFLPLLALLSANAPFAAGEYFGTSYRMANSYAIGPLRSDPWYRFQDIIFAKRLGTIELRIFDPVWDLERIGMIVRCIAAIASCNRRYSLDRETYNRLRPEFVRHGYSEGLRRLYLELSDMVELPEDALISTPSDTISRLYGDMSLVETYSALDNAYRNNVLAARQIPFIKRRPAKAAFGLASYYIVRLPYKLQKVWREW